MPLINCPDCNKEISANAPTCPGCGAPIAKDHESTGSGVQHLVTTQETSKKFKVHSLISLALFFGGLIGTGIVMPREGDPNPDTAAAAIPGLMIMIGIVWYIVNRFRIWWHHK